MHRIAPRPPTIDRIDRRPRRPRRLDLFGVLPERDTAAAMDDAEEARRLMDDLIALMEAGLVRAVDDEGVVRYAAADPDDLAA
jgi:hypothetical protein